MGRREVRKRGWWDGECETRKKKVRKELRRWGKEDVDGEEYRKAKRGNKELCDRRKKKEENERWERRVAGARREEEV